MPTSRRRKRSEQLLLKDIGITKTSAYSWLCRRRHNHDLRHTFAVKTLLGWYRDGADVAARMPLLSTYLGHVDPVATYWYLSASPELLGLAAGRLELASEQRSGGEGSSTLPWAGQRSRRARRQRMASKDER